VGERAMVGLSTHTMEQIRAASRQPISYIAIGPIFGTASKATGYQPVGLELIRQAREDLDRNGCQVPIVAIGGITLTRARSVIEAGAAAVAVISDLLVGSDPEQRVREFIGALR